MTNLLYQTDSYLQTFAAEVVEATPEGVVLSATAFYPGGGGQPADRGVLQGPDGRRYPVIDLRRQEGQLVHVLEGPERPPGGCTVQGKIDWERRYLLMRTHTAMHILCGVIWRDYGAAVTGGNMEPGKGRLDFEFEHMSRDLIDEFEQKINAEVAAARPIEVKILSREAAFQIPDLIRTKVNLLPPQIAQVRTVHIVGLDLQADGGTHVANTREVGPLKIVDYKSKGRMNKRITVALGPA